MGSKNRSASFCFLSENPLKSEVSALSIYGLKGEDVARFRWIDFIAGTESKVQAGDLNKKVKEWRNNANWFASEFFSTKNFTEGFLAFFFLNKDHSLIEYHWSKVALDSIKRTVQPLWKNCRSSQIRVTHISNIFLIRDENCVIYLLLLNAEAESSKTSFELFKLYLVGDTLKLERTMQSSQPTEIEAQWFAPHIHSNTISFLCFRKDSFVVVSYPFNYKAEHLSSTPKSFKCNASNLNIQEQIKEQKWSRQPSIFKNDRDEIVAVFYVFISTSKHGELWLRNCTKPASEWKKIFEIKSHAILVYSMEQHMCADGTMLIYGNCAEDSCKEKTHLYQIPQSQLLSPYLDQKLQFPFKDKILELYRTNAIFALNDMNAVHVLYGSASKKEKTLVALNKLYQTVQTSALESFTIIIYCSTDVHDQWKKFEQLLSNALPTHSSIVMKTVQHLDADVFDEKHYQNENVIAVIDSLEFLDFNKTSWLIKFTKTSAKVFVVLAIDNEKENENVTACERTDKFSYYELPSSTPITPHPESAFPAVSAERLDEFLNFSQYNMNIFYFGLKDNFVRTDRVPVCIPPCLDLNKTKVAVDPSDQVAYDTHKSLIEGQKSEEKLLRLFQQIHIGGIVIAGIDTKGFLKKVEKAVKQSADFWSLKEAKGTEIDVLFVHPVYGILAIEVKTNVCTKSEEQIKKYADQIPILFKFITGENFYDENKKPKIPFQQAVCSPSLIRKPATLKKSETKFIGHNEMSSSKEFKDCLENLCSKDTDTSALWQNREELKILLHKFITAIVGYRSTVSAPGLNALELHKKIANGNVNWTNCHSKKEIRSSEILRNEQRELKKVQEKAKIPFSRFGSTEQEKVFLSGDQLDVYECNEKRQIIIGPPGTGKTLLLMLKIIRVIKEEKGKVMVYSKSKALEEKFRHDLNDNIIDNSRIEWKSGLLNTMGLNLRPEMHFFADEEVADAEFLNLLKSRRHSSTSGKTIIAFTGNKCPTEANGIIHQLKDVGLYDPTIYKIFTLNRILRNTSNIADYWKFAYPDATMGHMLDGPNVTQYPCQTEAEQIEKLMEDLIPLLRETRCFSHKAKLNKGNPVLEPRNIAILTETEELAQLVRRKFNEQGIHYGTAVQQLSNRRLVAVDYFENVLSYEWPIVFAFGITSAASGNFYALITSSRAVSKLYNIFRDYRQANRLNYEQLLAAYRVSKDQLHALAKHKVQLSNENSPLTFCNIPPSHDWLTKAMTILNVSKDTQSFVERNGEIGYFEHYKAPSAEQVTRDGNAFFRSLSFLLLGSQDYHSDVRSAVVKYIKMEMDSQFSKYLSMDDNEYLKQMSKHDVHATHVEILAAASLFACNIFVFERGEHVKWICYNALMEKGEPMPDVPSLLLDHSDGQYFLPVLRM